MNRRLRILLLSGLLSAMPIALATTYDSTSVTRPTTTTKIQCTNFNFNYANATSVPTSTYAAFDPALCVPGTGGGVGFGAMTGGGNLGVQCPGSFPFITSITEGWGLFAGSGGAGSGVVCCSTPPNRVVATTSWVSPSGSGGCP